jgi:hypothetical protein
MTEAPTLEMKCHLVRQYGLWIRSGRLSIALLTGMALLLTVLAPTSYADSPTDNVEAQLIAPFPVRLSTTDPSRYSLLHDEIAFLVHRGIPYSHAVRAINSQSAIAHADLMLKLERAAGRSYGGFWFDNSTGQLRVATTSTADRRKLNTVIARTGLSSDAIVTTVHSTMAQLMSTQEYWDHRLARLISNENARTGIEAQRNTVSITIYGPVPTVEKKAIERAAHGSKTDISVTMVPNGSFRFERLANTECAPFAKKAAFCNPSITSGVTIENASTFCTAGPLAIPTAKRSQTVVITAGHCIGAPGEDWEATNKKGVKSVFGPAQTNVDGGKQGEGKGDYGDILIEPAWQTGKPIDPVLAVTAEWGEMARKKEETSYPVTNDRRPTVGNLNCHEGQTSGESCGEVKMTSVTLVSGGDWSEGLVEDGESPTEKKVPVDEAGDSGGPWLFIENKTSGEAFMEGSHVGTVHECLKVANSKGPQFFKTQAECGSASEFPEEPTNEGTWERKATANLILEPLEQPAPGAGAGSLEAMKLELLTTKNEVRPPRILNAKGEVLTKKSYTGKGGALTFETVAGSKISCTASTDSGEVSTTQTGAVTITATGCSGFGGQCHTSGAKAESEIVLGAKYRIAFINGAKTEVGIVREFTEATIECATKCPMMTDEKLKLRGSAISVVTPVNSLVTPPSLFKLVFSQAKGVQTPTEYENEEEKKVKAIIELEGSGSKTFAFEQAGISDTDELLFGEAAELVAA